MKQKDYSFRSPDEAVRGIDSIRSLISAEPHADALLTVYSSGIAKEDVNQLLVALDEALPDVKRAGISEYPYGIAAGDADEPITYFHVNAMVTESSRFHVMQHACLPGEERALAARVAESLGKLESLKGVAIYPSNPSLDVTDFLRGASAGLDDVPFFGAMAAQPTDAFGHLPLGGSFCIGPSAIESGFTLVAFTGTDLRVMLDTPWAGGRWAARCYRASARPRRWGKVASRPSTAPPRWRCTTSTSA